jgi:hypothetical protein
MGRPGGTDMPRHMRPIRNHSGEASPLAACGRAGCHSVLAAFGYAPWKKAWPSLSSLFHPPVQYIALVGGVCRPEATRNF